MSEFIPVGPSTSTPLNVQEQEAKTGSGLAIASFVTSLALIFLSAGFLSFIGSILGHVALAKLKKGQSSANRGLAIAGVIIGYVSTALAWIILVGFILLIVGATAVDSGWWSDFTREFDSNFNSY
jgi:hypothetical protein